MSITKICVKCKKNESEVGAGWFYASVDLNALLCDGCSYLFDNWCDTHRGEPFQNFIQPKPWQPRNVSIVSVGGNVKLRLDLEFFDYPESMDFDMTDETAWEALNNA